MPTSLGLNAPWERRILDWFGMSENRPLDASIVGSVLGKYRIISELSAGGMGEVYRAQHELLGRTAAVKVLRPELSSNADLIERFVKEAKAASAIRHPGIIEILDFGYTEDGRAYLVMEFLDGEPLSTRIRLASPMADTEVAQIARGIAGALTAAHVKGIIHRDLKPDNVMLVPDPDVASGERPKVLDFGIAKLADADNGQTLTGVLMGTPLYMAPEQAQAAHSIDHRADLYSLGCIMYEMLVGEPPFVAVGAGEIIAAQMFSPPQPPSERVPTISPRMERIVLGLLEKEPANRFQSAAELVEALGADFGAQVVRASGPHLQRDARLDTTTHRGGFLPSGAPSLDIAPPRRGNRLPIVAAVVTLAIAGGAVFMFTRGGDDARPAPAAAQPSAPPVAAPRVEPTPVEVKVTESDAAPAVESVAKKKPERPRPRSEKTKPKNPLPTTKQGSPVELTP